MQTGNRNLAPVLGSRSSVCVWPSPGQSGESARIEGRRGKELARRRHTAEQTLAHAKPLRVLTKVDEHGRECRAIDVERCLDSEDVLVRLEEGFVRRRRPEFIQSDKGAESTVNAVRGRLGGLGVTTLFVEPGSPWENGAVEWFHDERRGEALKREILCTPGEAKILTDRWRQEYHTIRPQGSLGYGPPAPEAVRWQARAAPALPLETAFGLTEEADDHAGRSGLVRAPLTEPARRREGRRAGLEMVAGGGFEPPTSGL